MCLNKTEEIEMRLSKPGYYFYLVGEKDKIEQYGQITGSAYVRKYGDEWILVAEKIMASSNEDEARREANALLRILKGIMFVTIGSSYPVAVGRCICIPSGEAKKEYTNPIIIGRVTLVDAMTQEKIEIAQRIFRKAYVEDDDYLIDCLKILHDSDVDFYDIEKVIEVIKGDESTKESFWDEIKNLAGIITENINSASIHGEKSRHTKYKEMGREHRESRRRSESEIKQIFREILSKYIEHKFKNSLIQCTSEMRIGHDKNSDRLS